MRFKHTLFFVFVFFASLSAHAQSTPVDFRKQLDAATADSQKLTVYRSIYDHYSGNSADSVMPYMEEAYARFEKSGYEHGQAAILLLLSNIYNEKGMLVVAREKGMQALNIFTRLKETQYIGKAHTTVGSADSYLGNYTEAVPHFLAALKCFETAKDTVGLVNTYLELGAANDYNRSHDKALGYYKKALDIALRTKVTATVVYLYNNIGLNYARNGNFDEALKYFEKAEEIGRDPKFAKAHLSPLINLGKVYNAKGDDKTAMKYLQQALELAYSTGAKERISRVLLEIGQIESKSTPPNTASLEKGFEIAKEINNKKIQADFLSALAAVAERTGNYKEEVSLLKQQKVLWDSIYNIDKAKAIANLQSEYDLKITSNQLAALERAEARNALKKNLIIVIAAILAVTLLTLIVFYTRSRRLNKELSAREQDLKKTNEVKDKLFSIIGHDLKGPIGNIPSLLSIYKIETDPEEREYILQAMEESSAASLETLEKLLSWGRQQLKGSTYNPTLVNVEQVMINKIKLLGVSAANKNITIVNRIPPAIHVYADENHFKFIMRNLISNAVKFTHSGGQVEVSAVHEHKGFVTFSVRDNGIGINKEMLQHIFEPYNESIFGTANEAGTSIGLMLCKEFVIQNGGNIWVESAKNQGTVFSFTVKSN